MTHLEIVVMIGMARLLVCWSEMDAEIERCARQCAVYRTLRYRPGQNQCHDLSQGRFVSSNDQLQMSLVTPAPSPAETAPTEASCVASTSGNVEAATVPSARRSTRTIRKPLRYL
ncbi:hypothetical protein MRX96_027916 [Rhipicephalus microplus]